ncbi:hypothetical protein HJFPF1_02906 [Paramyrothecium foliicola]|nr:hypothetical protein HJFPF1_02906 [Paramyrothecium foliicola]
MIVSQVAWRRPVATLPCLKRQKTSKAFVRHVDEHGNPYYMFARNKKQQVPKPVSSQDLFRISNLLLDLDAEGSRNVRSLNSEDEEQLSALWATGPARKAARTRVNEFRTQITEARLRKDEIHSHRTNVWRISPHDILAAAVNNVATTNFGGEAASNADLGLSYTQNILSNHNATLTEAIRQMNGIPSHASAHDELLLGWMVTRRDELLDARQVQEEAQPSVEQVFHAMQDSATVTSLRRLIFQTIDAGLDIRAFADELLGQDLDLAQEARRICMTILAQYPDDASVRVEMLSMIGNLSERLASRGLKMGLPLRGLGLALSAGTGSSEASFRYLSNGLADNTWLGWVGGPGDVLLALEAYTSFLDQNPHSTAAGHHVDYQRVLQLLTGLDENNTLAPESFRTLVFTYLKDANINDSLALGIYLSYIRVLGRLGALRTVWKESRIALPLIAERLAGVDKKAIQTESDDIAGQFLAAVQYSSKVVVSKGRDTTSDMSLEECATLDYHALQPSEDAPLDVGLKDETEDTAKPISIQVNPSILGGALEAPLHEWLVKIEYHSRT